MTRKEATLLMLAMTKDGKYTPVQIQKAMFLITKNYPEIIEGKNYDFKPYAYGPFDKTVFDDIRILENEGFVQSSINISGQWNEYQITSEGLIKAEKIKKQIIGEGIIQYFEEVSSFVRSLSFSKLVTSIYKAYPEMKINSIFRE
jgi:uncharacterized protein YwgA